MFHDFIPRLCAREPHRRSADFDRHAPGGVALIRAVTRITRNDDDLRDRQSQLFRRNLRNGSDYSLSQFNLGGKYPNDARLAEIDPLSEQRVFLNAARKCMRRHGLARCATFFHAASIALTIRVCAPHLHKLRSKAATIFSRAGSVLFSNNSIAVMMIPER